MKKSFQKNRVVLSWHDSLSNRVYRVVFESRVPTQLIIGSGSCWTRLRNRVSRVDMNPTREPELPSLIKPIRGISF